MARDPRRGRRRQSLMGALAQVRGPTRCCSSPRAPLVAARDPHGFRPLLLGDSEGGPASPRSSCAFDLIGAAHRARARAGRGAGVPRTAAWSSFRMPRAAAADALHLRARLLRAPGQRRLRRRGVRGAPRASGAQLAREAPADADLVVAGARQRRLRRPRLRARVGPALRVRPDPQPLRRAHLHRAEAVDPPLRREDQAQPGARADRGQAAWCWSTTRSSAAPRAEDRQDAPRRRRRARCTCASPRRRRAGPATTASTRRRARS